MSSPKENDSYRIIRAGLETGIPVILTGPPGTGKTGWVLALEDKQLLGRPTKVFQMIASLREPVDLGGYPIPKDGWVSFAPISFWRDVLEAHAQGYAVVIFYDEARTISAPVQAALMKNIHERRAGDLELPFDLRFIMAANSVDESASGVPIEPPLANRLMHIAWKLDAGEWCEGMISGRFRPQSPLSETALQALGAERANVAAFIHHRRDLILQVPKTEEERDGPWPSPRTLDYTAHLWATVGPGDEQFRQELMASCVGVPVAAQYITWRNSMDLPDPEEVLAGKVKKLVHEDRPDITYSILSSAIAAVIGNWTPERYAAGWKVLGMAADQGCADIAAAVLRSLEATREGKKNLPFPTVETAKFLDLLKRAGMDLS